MDHKLSNLSQFCVNTLLQIKRHKPLKVMEFYNMMPLDW